MKLPRLRTVVVAGGCIGLVIPVVLLLLAYATRSASFANKMMLILSPGYSVVLAAERYQYSIPGYAVLVVLCVANAFFYSAIFTVIWSIGWMLKAWRASLRDGTTI